MNEMDHRLLEQHMQLHGLLGRYFHHIHTDRGHLVMPYSGQGRVLKFLKYVPEISQKELADLLGIRSQSLGETLAKLEKNECITRAPAETDRRKTMIRITEKGLKTVSGDAKAEEQDEVFSCLSQEEKEQLEGLFEKVISSLEQKYSGTCPKRETRMHCERRRRFPADAMDGRGEHF